MAFPTAIVEQPPEQQAEEDTSPPYLYPEFCGPGGDRYLKKLLRQILPMALYRTWEIFADHQARGNDCYLSIAQLALLAGRALRTMQKNVASLQAKKLLVERAERKTFRGSDGQSLSRMVVVKDFHALYALAHEYHQWCHSEEMIPPERAYAALLSQHGELVAKLRRFDNYRRLLYNHAPGPGHVEQEEDRWFTEYQPGMRAEDMAHCQPIQAPSSNQSAEAPNLAAKEPSKEVSKETPKRISESSQRDDIRGNSFDSVSSFSDPSGRREGSEGSHKALHQPISGGGENAQEPGPMPQQSGTQGQPPQPGQRSDRTHSFLGNAQEETSQAVQAAREAMAYAIQHQVHQQGRRRAPEGSLASPRPPDHPLARSFLCEIAAPFGDRNPKGSATRILNILAHASLEEGEVLLCLVRAYTIARDTRTIRSVHSEPETGRANRMPLFCTLFERFVQARLHNDKWKYSWQQLEDDLTADDRLFLWWNEHQALLAQKTPNSPEYHLLGAPDAFPKEQDEKQEGPPDSVGWTCREAAHSWGERLLEALVAAGYEAEVRVHLEKQSYQLLFVGDGNEWVLSTPLMVQEAIEIIQNTDDNP